VAHSSAQAQFRYTGWSLLAGNGTHFSRGGGPTGFRDCQFAGGQFHSFEGLLGLTNCLWERVYGDPHADDGGQVFAYNNLFRGGSWFFDNETEYEWIVKDNLFDTVSLSQSSGTITHGYNGYISTTHLSGSSGGDVDITPPADYEPGPLGAFYHPTSGAGLHSLEDAGSRSAAAAGLGDYTTRPDQALDGGPVDIGFHFKAVKGAEIVGWAFTDQGFIAGGQNGAFRAYEDPTSVAASPWSFLSPDKRSFRVSFEDDGVTCSGANQFIQVATAAAAIMVGSPTVMPVSWSGIVEWQNAGYDKMFLYVDDCQVASAESREEGRGCDYMGPPNSNPGSASVSISLDPGLHLLGITVETVDNRYHVGAYYQFELNLQSQ